MEVVEKKPKRSPEEKKAAHREAWLKQQRQRDELKKQRKCILCGDPAVTKNHCEECRDWINDRNRANRRALTCPHCGGAVPLRRNRMPPAETPQPNTENAG